MKIQFLNGKQIFSGGLKPTFLKDLCNKVLKAHLDDDGYYAAGRPSQPTTIGLIDRSRRGLVNAIFEVCQQFRNGEK